ncbi:MAG: TonB-dependent receptor [Tannerella sp.]|nr:TonB-dependent receptor [Tannerella sp.]
MKSQKYLSRRDIISIPLFMLAFALFTGIGGFSSAMAGETANGAMNSKDDLSGTEDGVTVAEQQQQQSITVRGTVVDENGEAVIGANIVEKGSGTNGTSTDADGKFTLTVPRGATLYVSFIGYIPQSITASGEALRIILKEDSQALDEVVVTGFGLAQKKATLTGAISAIGSKEISRSLSPTASGALVGKVAGLNTRQVDGRPGASTSIQIRNMGTPLYVIDGIISDEGQFNNLDFNDIDAITILKDATASIYGVRAANGVIVVTTKKGATNTRNTVSLNAYYGWQTLSEFPHPANAATYVEKYIMSETVQGKSGTQYTYSRDDLAKWQQGTEKGYVPFDWYDFIFETAPQLYVNANITGGSDKINYYVSIGNLTQDAMIVNYGGFERTNLQMNIDAKISDKLKVGASMNGRIETRVNPGVPQVDDYWMPRFGVYRNLPTRRPYANDNVNYPTTTGPSNETNFAWLNYELSGRMEDTWRIAQLQANAEYDIMAGLKAKVLVGYYFAYRNHDNQEYTYKLYGYDEDTDTYPVIFENLNPWRERTTAYNEDINSNIQLSYDKKFGDHTVSAQVGFESWQRDHPQTWVHSRPTANSLHLIDYPTMDTYNDDGLRTNARLGWIGHLNYDYANKYLLEASARYDGSYRFAPGHRWGLFPSASVGWRLSEEAFWSESKLHDVFSDFKLRGSYGLVGSDDIGSDFNYLSGYTYKSGGAVIDDKYVIGSVARGLPVTTLSWIKAYILNIGVDVSFLKNRLNGQAEFFRRHRTGLAASRYDVLLPSEVGFSLPQENLNSDVHMGYEFQLNWNDNIDELAYRVGANLTYARFYDYEQYKPRRSNSWDYYRNSIWHRYGYVNWGLEAIGQFESWEEIAEYTIDNDRQGNKTLRPGDIKYKDVNGDNTINGMDERPIGFREGSTPILNWGINLGATWRGFELGMDFTGGALSSWYQDYEQRNPFHDGGNNPQYYMEDTWRLADIWDANSNYVPGKYPMLLIGNSSHSNYWNSSFWKKNVAYVKLRNLELGYNIPKHVLDRLYLAGLKVYVAGTNVFTLCNIMGVDPESDQSNGLGYPTTRVINVGLNIKF